jgi:hypothetical protein
MARRWSASIALLAFQVTPVTVKPAADGRLDIGIGFSGDKYMQEAFGCDGAKLWDRPVESAVVSALVDYVHGNGMRISGFVGSAASKTGECSSSLQGSCGFSTPFDGAFGGALIAREGKSFGLGVGIAMLPHSEYTAADDYTDPVAGQKFWPALHARFGNREGKYVRLDVNTVNAPGQVPMSSLGMGFGKKGVHSERGFIGIGVLPYPDVGEGIASVITGNVAIPIRQAGDVLVGGYLGAGQARGFSVGARLHLKGGT